MSSRWALTKCSASNFFLLKLNNKMGQDFHQLKIHDIFVLVSLLALNTKRDDSAQKLFVFME